MWNELCFVKSAYTEAINHRSGESHFPDWVAVGGPPEQGRRVYGSAA